MGKMAFKILKVFSLYINADRRMLMRSVFDWQICRDGQGEC